MKKTLILLGFVLSLNAFGQFNTESIYFSGMTSFATGLEIQSSDFEGGGFIPFELRLEGGYFIKNRMAVGGNISIEDYRIPLWGTVDNYYYEVHFGPTIRYYIPGEEDWHTYLFGYGFYGFEPSHQFFGLQFGPGVNYFFNESIALDARVSYTYKHTFNREFGGSHNNHRLLFEIGISVFFPSIRFFDQS
jgi:hypothetical protein